MKPTAFSDIPVEAFKGVLIDLDDTIYSYEAAHVVALTACWRNWISPLPFEQFDKAYRNARDAVTEQLAPQAACRSRLFAFQMMLEASGYKEPYIHALRLNELYWSNLISAMTVDESALMFLRRCSELGVRTCIVSDMTASIQIRKIEKLGICGYIDRMVTSEEVGAEKPDPRMFETAARKLGLQLSEVAMVGDNYHKDCLGAARLGVRSYLIELAP